MSRDTTRSTRGRQPFRPLPFEIPAVAELAARGCSAEQRAGILRLFRQYIARHGYLPTDEGPLDDVIDAVARLIDGERVAKATCTLNAIGLESGRDSEAFDAAVEYSTVFMHAAMAFGYTMGMALAQNGDPQEMCN